MHQTFKTLLKNYVNYSYIWLLQLEIQFQHENMPPFLPFLTLEFIFLLTKSILMLSHPIISSEFLFPFHFDSQLFQNEIQLLILPYLSQYREHHNLQQIFFHRLSQLQLRSNLFHKLNLKISISYLGLIQLQPNLQIFPRELD